MMCEFQNSWKHLRWPVCSLSCGMLADDLSLYILFPVTQSSSSHNQNLTKPPTQCRIYDQESMQFSINGQEEA